MKKDKKDTILIYTDAINMAVYRALEYSELGELMLALFEYNNGKEKNESDFSNEELYDLYTEYKEKVDDNNKKFQSKKARNERYQAKKNAENNKELEEPTIQIDNLTEETGPQENNEERFVGFLHPRY